jgi:hypothetical protein
MVHSFDQEESMSAAPSTESYASGLYTDLRGRLVFYAAFEHAGGVVVAALATEGPLRTTGDFMHLASTTLAELGSVGTLAAKLVVDADLKPAGRRKIQAAIGAAAALGFVRDVGAPEVLPAELRCSRWIEFRRRAGDGIFNAWSMRVPSILPALDANSAELLAAERILVRWPLSARALASCGSVLPSELVEAVDDELAEALVDHLFARPSSSWDRADALSFVRSLEGILADVEFGDMVELAGCLPVAWHPQGLPDLEGFDGAAALHAEMKRHRILPRDVACLFTPFAEDWTRSPLRTPSSHGKGSEETAEDACELLLAHVAAMARRFGVPAWLEMTVPDFRDLPARTADNLVLAVILALAEESSDGMAPMADVFLRDLDLKRLLWSLGIEQTRAKARTVGTHAADVEGNFRDAEAAGELAGRIAQRLRTGGARRIGVELVESGFGAGLDVARIRREMGADVPRPRRFAGMPSPPIVQATPARPPVIPRMGPVRMAAGIVCGAGLALLVAGFGLSASPPPGPSPTSKTTADDHRPVARQTSDWASLSRLVDRREDLGNAVRGNPAPCPLGDAGGTFCGRFGDLTFVLRNWSTPKPAMAAYVVEGRHPVEVFSWSSTSIRQPTGAWTRHLLEALDARAVKQPVEPEAKALADVRIGGDR